MIRIILFFILISACTPRPSTIAISGRTMGTTYNIKVAALLNNSQILQLKNEIDQELLEINKQMSIFIPTSELSQFNDFKKNSWFQLSHQLYFVLNEALNVSRMSDGAFDITVGPLVNLWGFGPQHRSDIVPTSEQIRKIKQKTGHTKVSIKEFAIKKHNPDIYLDLGAIAKGHGVDLVSKFLISKGHPNHIVEIGGEVRAAGHKPDGKRWRIAIESPLSSTREISKVLSLDDLSMATSGDYRNYFEKDGKRFSHTIDPRSGTPITHRLASVTIVDRECIRADALATTLMVLGEVEGFEFAKKNKLAALLFVKDHQGFKELMTEEFKRLLLDGERP